MNYNKIVLFKWDENINRNDKSLNRLLRYIILFIFFLTFNSPIIFSQFIIHVQDWEGVAGSGNWLRVENDALPHNFTRGTDTDAVYAGNKASYISENNLDYGYDETTAAEAFAYKNIEFPETGDFFIKFDWKCIGEVFSGIAYDYMRVFLVPTTTGLNETDLVNEANGFEILGPGTENRFVEQGVYATLNYQLTDPQNSLIRNKEYRLVMMWKNDASLSDGAPAAFDNVIISDGDATQPLSGTYQIGKNSAGSQRFDSLMHATSLLNINGVSGNVNFELTDEDYTIKTGDLPVRIEDFNSNLNSTVSNAEFILQPLQNGSITPTISGSVDNSRIFLFDKADNITINGDNGGKISNDLTIENNSSTNPIGLHIGSDIGTTASSDNIEIKNININLGNTTGAGILTSAYNAYSAGLFTNITISNNSFKGGRRAIYVIGDNGTANGSGLNIQNNSMDDNINPQGVTGVEINGTVNIDILNNIIGNINSSDNSNIQGIRLGANSSNVLIEKNEIYNLSHSSNYGANGISLASNIMNAGIQIRNNMIYNISADGWDYTATYLDNAIGIAVEGNQSGISILNNSIYLKEGGSNILTANADSYTACISIGTGATINALKNNILINTLGGDNSGAQPAGYTTIAYQETSFTDHFPDIDYNFYYNQVGSIAGGTESLASNFSNSASSLDDLKTLSENDLSSIGASSLDISTFNGAGFTFDPERLFLAISEGTGEYLRIDDSQQEAWLISAAGTHLVDMTEDFSGNSRNTVTTSIPPSLGAFEFTTNTQPVTAYQDGAIADAATSDFYVGNRKILSLNWNENGGSLPTAIEVNYFPGSLPPDTDGHPVFNGYVQITATGGSGFEYDIELAYEPALLGGISTNDIILTKRPDDVNDWSTWPTTVNTVNRVFSVSNIDNGFSYFTGTDQNDQLPVELISFSAKVLHGEIEIQWETASEKNNDHFIVEKKGLDNEWKNISTVQGAGNSNNLLQYAITDLNPISGTQYYRLKQVDTDGKFEYSHVLRIEYGSNRQLVFPNPFKDKIFVKNKGENSVKRIELKNITGNSINTTVEYLGQNKWEVNTQSLETGTYILYVYMENQVEIRKLIKR